MDHWLNLAVERVALVVMLVLSLSVHEWAHAFSADRLGDDTARRAGKLTLDPRAHIDPVGTLLFPALLGIPFGWAKPVPISPFRFRRGVSRRGGMMLASAAGPASNLALAFVVAVLFGLLSRYFPGAVPRNGLLDKSLTMLMNLNVLLAVLNILPVPPLDGGRVADALIPSRFERYWSAYCRYAPFVLLVIFLAPNLLPINVLGWPEEHLRKILLGLKQAVAAS